MDLTCCILALPVLGLSAAIMTVIVQIISPGPIIFRQERIGFQKRRFMIFKFRTMTVNADSMIHRNHVDQLMASQAPMTTPAATRNARLIPGGWILRASGIDELPQIINVLRGEMSLVGPRPFNPSEYQHALPAHDERFDVLPGLTGLWQVSGRNRTTIDEMMHLDVHYARNASFLLNLKIVLLTPWALLVQIYDTRVGRKSAIPARSPHSAVRD